jgi:hypothetical protein
VPAAVPCVATQVYDLSKLEGDEYGLAGGSPPPVRDTNAL